MENVINNQKKKLPIKRILSNNFYILKFAFNIFPVYYCFYIFSSVITTAVSSLYYVLMVKFIIDSVTRGENFGHVLKLIIIAGVIMIFNMVIHEVTYQMNIIKSKEISGVIQRRIMKKAFTIDLIHYDRSIFYDEFMRAGSQADKQINDSIQNIVSIISQGISILTVTAVAFVISPIIVIFPVTAFVLNLITSVYLNKLNYNMQIEIDPFERAKYYSRRVFYFYEYAKEIRLTNIKEPIRRQFENSIEAEKAVIKKHSLKIALVSLANSVLAIGICMFYLPPLYLSYNAAVTGRIKIGDFASMNNASRNIFDQLNIISWAISNVQQIGLYGEHFRSFIELKTNIENTIGSCNMPPTLKEIKIKNLSFKYDDKSKYVLKDINMTIKPREKIAIVGLNGAGKSTFIKLLMRLYDPTEGEISYNGININEFSTKEYRNVFGAVFQDFQVYAATLAENIVMDHISEENRKKVEDALAFVGMDEKLKTLKRGIDAPLTREFEDEGIILSGGQAQRLAISRVFVNEHSIAILDEPSSALDPITEYDLNKSMLKAAKDSTVIFISHRLSTTRMADKIYMFEAGRIIEQGSHDELMELNGIYADMFRKQACYYKETTSTINLYMTEKR